MKKTVMGYKQFQFMWMKIQVYQIHMIMYYHKEEIYMIFNIFQIMEVEEMHILVLLFKII